MKTSEFKTEDLAVAGVEVVALPEGKAFLGPYYLDQAEQLRDALRGMARRENFVVAQKGATLWIYRRAKA